MHVIIGGLVIGLCAIAGIAIVLRANARGARNTAITGRLARYAGRNRFL